jgi:hypothetical protein
MKPHRLIMSENKLIKLFASEKVAAAERENAHNEEVCS